MSRRPGGNYTQAEWSPHTEKYTFVAYVCWEEVGRFDNAQDAENAVRRLRSDRKTIVIIDPQE